MTSGVDDGSVTPAVFDIEAALAPISGDDPCGVDLTTGDSTEVSDLRARARSEETATAQAQTRAQTEPPGERAVDGASPARWGAVSAEALDLLGRSKDVRIALVLVQSLTRVHGFAGLRDGLILLNRLLETYPEGAYPRSAEERRRFIAQYFANRPALLRACDHAVLVSGPVELGQSEGNAGGKIEASITRQALMESGDSDYVRQRRRKDQLVASTSELQTLIRSPHAAADVAAARRVLDEVDEQLALLRDRLTAPGAEFQTTEISGGIAELRSFLGAAAPQAEASPGGADSVVSDAGVPSGGAAVSAADGGSPGARSSGPGDRSEALATILRLAAWFESREPQGTVHHDLRRAVRRAKLPLDKIMQELASESGGPLEDSMRRRLLWNLGVDPEKIDPSGSS